VVIVTCRQLDIPIRQYLRSVLPGLAEFPANRVSELTMTALAAAFELAAIPHQTQIQTTNNMKSESVEINLSGKYNITNIDGMTVHTLLTALADAERMYKKAGMPDSPKTARMRTR